MKYVTFTQSKKSILEEETFVTDTFTPQDMMENDQDRSTAKPGHLRDAFIWIQCSLHSFLHGFHKVHVE